MSGDILTYVRSCTDDLPSRVSPPIVSLKPLTMSINYDWYPSPKKSADEPTTLHVRPVFNGSVSTDDLAESLQTATSLTIADVKAVLQALNREVGRQLAGGCRVHLEGLGYLTPRLRVEGEVTEDILLRDRNRMVRFSGVNFLADKQLTEAIGAVRLSHTPKATHSQELDDALVEERLADYFTTHDILTRAILQRLLHLSTWKATALLRRLCEEGKLRNASTDFHPAYVPAEGLSVSLNPT